MPSSKPVADLEEGATGTPPPPQKKKKKKKKNDGYVFGNPIMYQNA